MFLVFHLVFKFKEMSATINEFEAHSEQINARAEFERYMLAKANDTWDPEEEKQLQIDKYR